MHFKLIEIAALNSKTNHYDLRRLIWEKQNSRKGAEPHWNGFLWVPRILFRCQKTNEKRNKLHEKKMDRRSPKEGSGRGRGEVGEGSCIGETQIKR